jgi:hypothetical protein
MDKTAEEVRRMKLGKWISNGTDKPFYARKEFEVAGAVKKAKAFVSGLGQFIFSMNGKKAGDHVMDPGWTNYDKIVQYIVFDITNLLKKGKNAVGIEVGNGWYIRDFRRYVMKYPGFKPPIPNPYKPFGKYLTASILIEIEYEHRETEHICTDESWMTNIHPTTLSNVYGSEIMDGRLRQNGWNEAGFKDTHWQAAMVLSIEDSPKGILMEQAQPPIIIKRVYEAEYLHTNADIMIYDLKQNMSAILEFEVKGKCGDVIDVLPAEKLDAKGNIDQMAKGWGLIDVMETYIIGQDNVWETFCMSFTYFAGRYLAVKGITDSNVSIRNIKAYYITNASKTTGSFEGDDKRYTQIYNLVLRAVECNLLSVHTDCPTIERFAWQEPNHLMVPSIMYMKNVDRLWRKFLLDLRTDQCTKDEWYPDGNGGVIYPGEGTIPAIAPRYESNVVPSSLGSFFDIIPWGSSCILGTYWHYIFYGDKQVISDNYDAGKKYLNHLKTKVTKDGFICHGLGDWGNPDKRALVRENVETVFLYADAKVLSEFASILGVREDEKEFMAYANEVKNNYNHLLLQKHPEKGFYCYRAFDHADEFFMTQSCEALPLYWGMVPNEKESDVKAAFAYIMDRDRSFVSGEVGLPYIIQTMCRCGMNDMVCDFIMKKTHPSYYSFIINGETTLGEYWEENPRSHCHDMMGHIIEWFYNGIAGIIPLKPGFSKILIKPYIPKSMNVYSCVYDSIKGKIAVNLERDGKRIKIRITIPNGVEYITDSSELDRQGLWVEWIKM